MKVKSLFAAILASAAVSAQAAPATIVDLTVTGGNFGLGNPNTNSFGAISWDLVDGYGSQAGLFSFFFMPVNVFTGDGSSAPFGGTAVTGGSVPSGTVDAVAGTISMDMSAWTAFWNGTNFNQGASSVSGTYDGNTGAFSMSWTSTISGGPFSGQTGYWTMNGTAVAAVPEAETYAMMLAGLGLVGFAVRRRQAA